MPFRNVLRISLALPTILLLSSSLLAQRGSGRAKTPAPSNPGMPTQETVTHLISGKVVLDDGSPLTDQATIQSVCKGLRHAETYTDSSGNFYFEFGKQRSSTDDIESSSMGEVQTVGATGRSTSGKYSSDCQLQALLPGFTSDVIEMSRFQDDTLGSVNVGNIVLHRLKNVEGTTISATTAAAPPNARKAYDKARQDVGKGKLEDAQKNLEKAVSVYPQFAVAWVELGRIQAHFKNFDAARQSFTHAIDADPKLVTPYETLAQIALQQRQWEELVNVTNRLLSLNALSFPQDWFYNALGNYYLNRLDPAQKSAQEGLKADLEHRVPKLDYLLAMVLMQKREFSAAAEHFRSYLAHLPNPGESASVQAQLANAERLSRTTLGQNAQQK